MKWGLEKCKRFHWLALFISAFMFSCVARPHKVRKDDSGNPQSWSEVIDILQTFSDSTHYDEIVLRLGQPYEQYLAQSMPEETVLYFTVPGGESMYYWIIMDTDSRYFLYAGDEQYEKE